MNKIAYLILGAPGSGKTTFAKTLGGRLFEVDDYDNLYNDNGTMNFDLLKYAHESCKKAFEDSAILSEPCIIHTIINYYSPNTKHYIEVAERYGYELNIMRPQYGILFYPNTFSTKEEQIQHIINLRKEGTSKYVPEAIIRACC